MKRQLRTIRTAANPYAGSALGIGLAGVAWHNWRAWQRDKTLAERIAAQRTAAPTLAHTPKVSAIVAAWNERVRIDDHLRSFLALAYPNIELILIAGGDDDTLLRAQGYAGERVIVLEQQPGEGKQRALARGYTHATGDLIYLIDADCLFSDEALTRLIAPIVNEGEQVATGTICPLPAQQVKLLPRYAWAMDMVTDAHTPIHIHGLRGANTIMTRRALDASGGLQFTARTGTDYQLAQRLLHVGRRIRYVGGSVVPSEYAETFRTYRQRQSRWLRNLLMYGRRSGAHADMQASFKTIGTGTAMLAAPLAHPLLGWLIITPWSVLFVHALCSKLRYILLAAKLQRRPISLQLLIGLVPLTLVDFVVWASPILDLLTRKRREQW